MKKLLLISLFAGVLPLSMTAQVDDLYFVPKKKSVDKVTDHYGMPKDVYYSGSNRSVDEYNRRTFSHYEPIGTDSTVNDTINFIGEKGVYPDSTATEDFNLTKYMSRFDDYNVYDNAAFWAGYQAGRYDWGWHSPWYYSRFGWYDYWYDPWYYGRWGWYDPFYYGWYGGWYSSWYNPWYYNTWYVYPWNYGGYYLSGGGGAHYHAPTIGGGTIRRDGMTYGSRNSSIARNSSRMNELRFRTVSGNSRYDGNSRVSSRTNSSSYNSSRANNSSFSGSRSSNSSFSGSRSSSGGGGGSFSGGGGSRGGGGGGSRMGGRR